MVRVLPDVPALARRFDYLVPSRLADAVRVGTRVRVVLHGRRVGGWVTAVDAEPPAGVSLRPIAAVSGWGPPADVVELAEWAAWRWAGPVSSFLRTASPDRVVRSLPPRPPEVARPGRLAEEVPGAIVDQVDLARHGGEPTLLQLPPGDDLLPVVAAVLARLVGGGRSGSSGGAAGPGPGPGSVLVLVPSTGWAGRLSARLVRRGVPVAATWAEAAAGWPVVIGTRAAAWSPLPHLAAAVVLDVHDEGYREERSPTSDAWELVVERARRVGAPCISTSPCPTVVQRSRCRGLAPDRGHERSGWPPVVVIDRRGADPRTGLLSDELVGSARRALAAGQRVICVLNRTGRAGLLACAACGELARCEHCGRPLKHVDERLRCPGCGLERPVVCARCGASRTKVLRPGTARLRDDLEALLQAPVAEVAGPVRPERRGADGVPEAPPGQGGAGPLAVVGTEAALHRFRQAGLVAFLDFDQHLLAPRFAAGEQALALLVRAGRLVGARREEPGPGEPRRSVLVQTRLPDHEVLVAAVRGDPDHLARHEADVRRSLALPPHAALAVLSGPGAAAFAADVTVTGAPRSVEVTDLGDGSWLARGPDHQRLCDALAEARRPPGRLRVEVDPVDV